MGVVSGGGEMEDDVSAALFLESSFLKSSFHSLQFTVSRRISSLYIELTFQKFSQPFKILVVLSQLFKNLSQIFHKLLEKGVKAYFASCDVCQRMSRQFETS